MDFTGKTAIITGAAKGIGRGCAEILARGGANVVLADINLGMAREAERALTEEGLRAKAVQVDVKSVAEIEKMVRAADEAFGTVDILVNNAGIFHATPIEEITEQEWDNIVDINLKSVFFATQKVLPYIEEKEERKNRQPFFAGRTQRRFYQRTGLLRGQGGDHRPDARLRGAAGAGWHQCERGCPGSTDTGILDGLGEDGIRGLTEKIPLGRFGKTPEVASVVAFLCSEEAAFMTGAVVDVNGGMYFG